MILIKADEKSEAGILPDEKLLTEMGKYNGTEPEIEIRPVFEMEDFAASDPTGAPRAQGAPPRAAGRELTP